MDIIKDLCRKLCSVPGVSGAEFPASETARSLLSEYMADAAVDRFGNVTGSLYTGEKFPTLLLDAHIDEIGMAVTYIEDNGFIKIGRVGGLDFRVLPAQTVTVWASLSDKPVKGVICTLPPHVAEDDKKAVKESDVAIDTGYSKEQLEKLCLPGDRITVDSEFTELLNGRISSHSLDDRSGAVSILYALYLLKNNGFRNLKYNIKVAFTAQEEIGGRGAVIAAYNADADYAVSVDVSYGFQPGTDERKTGKLGKGAMLGVSPVLDREMFLKMKQLAEKNEIPYQIEVMSSLTGTNADEIGISRGGVRCALLSIPERNMHMPVELLQISDIETVGKLISLFLETEAAGYEY